MPPAEALREARAVFLGTCVAASGPPQIWDDPAARTGAYFRTHTFEVQAVWRGPFETRITIHTEPTGAECGRDHRVGETYLVYAQMDEGGSWRDHLCSRTRPLAQAREDLVYLGPPAWPDPPSPSHLGEPEDLEAPRTVGRIEPPPLAIPASPGCEARGPAPHESGMLPGLAAFLGWGPRRRTAS